MLAIDHHKGTRSARPAHRNRGEPESFHNKRELGSSQATDTSEKTY